MPRLDEQLSEQFRKWELRGRGWQVYDEPVFPEPPFRPFIGHYLPDTVSMDDGRRPTALSSLFKRLTSQQEKPPVIPQIEEEPEPGLLVREPLVELQTSLPSDLNLSKEAFEQFLLNLSLCREPVAFELLGIPNRVTTQFAVHLNDASQVQRQLQAYFPEAVFQAGEGALEKAWDNCEGDDTLVVEFGLAREFMFPLQSGKLDPFIGIVGALAELQRGELALFQVLFQHANERWPESILRSATHAGGKPFFVDAPELAKAAENKISKPLYAAVVRIAIKTETQKRTLQIARDLASSLRVFAHPQGNELIPLKNDDYPFEAHVDDVLRRQTRRTGMLLNSDELIGFVHLPGSAVRSPALQRDTGKTKAAPAIVQNLSALLLGNNVHFGKTIQVRLTAEQRTRHTHILGASGTGKSTLLFNLIRQDIENGEGVAVLDPHGDLVDKILGIIPCERISDVVLVDPSDEEFSIGFNILSAHSEHEKTLLASDLVSVFQRLSTSWGDQMQSVLQNAILAFLNSSRGGTLADLRRFLVEPAFRADFLKSVSDPNILYYWQKGFSHLSGNKSIGPILTRLEMFLAQPPIARMVSQRENRLDFGNIMDTGKIFLAKLPEGLLGRENSYLLGALLVSKFQQLVMARQAKKIAARRDFWIYIDEFANFITPTMAEILSGARKYRIGLTLAHHELHQLQRIPEVASAVMTHPFTRIVFRVGDDDAKKLADGFSFFEANDLKNLEAGQAIARVERSNFDFNLSVPFPEPIDEAQAKQREQEVITASREKYGRPRAEVEAMLREAWEVEPPKARAKIEVSASPLPKLAEVKTNAPEATGSEEEMIIGKASESKPVSVAVPTAALKVIPDEPEAPRDLGRGDDLHKSIQARLQKEAHQLGFLAQVESQLKTGSMKAADLALKRDDLTIAIEVAVTGPIHHEFENVKKCLDVGFSRVAVVSITPERLAQIAAAVQGGLGSESLARVSYHSPDELIAELRKIAKEMPVKPAKPNETVRRGFKVRRHGPALTPEERKSKEQVAHEILSEVMKAKQ
jgi:hypothetical protein